MSHPGNNPGMAARRLLAFLVALMVISAIAAALAPPQQSAEESSTSSTTTTSEPGPDDVSASQGKAGVVNAMVDAGAAPGGSADSIRAKPGDQLALTVRSDATREIQIPGLGLYETAARGAPALFDVIVYEEGEFRVFADERRVATISVSAKPGGSPKPPGPKREPGAGDRSQQGRQQPMGQPPRDGGSSLAA
jgi:hypothetical protein